MATTPSLSVSVCTWNRAELLDSCLSSLVEQQPSQGRGRDWEILVIDDGSSDSTPAVTERHREASLAAIRYLPQPHGGLSRARNRAVREARANVVLFMDDDQLAPAGHLMRVLERLEASPTAAGIGGPVRDQGGGPRTCERCSLGDVDVPGEGLRRVDRLLGGNMAIRKSAFAQVGPFDDEISGRGDETEWFHRAQGLEFLQDPELWVWHRRDHTSLLEVLRQAIRQGRALPLSRSRTGLAPKAQPRRILFGLAHAARRRCAMGLVIAAREIGALLGPPRGSSNSATEGATRPRTP